MVDINLAAQLTGKFMQEHPALTDVKVRLAEKQEQIYGKENTVERVGEIRGGYYPRSNIAAFATSSIRNAEVFGKTLRHELYGHFGINTFSREQKRAILDRLVDSENEPSLKKIWDDRKKDYSEASKSMQAEEVFATISERVTNDKQKANNAALSWEEAIKNKSRPLNLDDVVNIAEMVASGLRDNTRQRVIIPESDNAQFSKKALSQNEIKARDFQSMKASDLAQKHPDLKPHLVAIKAIETKLANSQLSTESQRIAMQRVNENVARSIEQGKTPKIQTQQKQKTAELTR